MAQVKTKQFSLFSAIKTGKHEEREIVESEPSAEEESPGTITKGRVHE